MIRSGKLIRVGGGSTLILHLCPHGRSVRIAHRYPFCRPRRYAKTTRSAVVAHMGVGRIHHDCAAIDVVHHSDVNVVDRAVVVEVSPTPVTALVAVARVAKTIINAAIVTDVLSPIARVISVGVIPVAPVAGGPECALVRGLDPCTGHPEISIWRPRPVAGRPQIVVAGIRWLVVVQQRRGRLGIGVLRLLSVTRIIRRRTGRLIRRAALIRRRALLVAGSGGARIVWSGGHVGRGRIRTRLLRASLVVIRRRGRWILAATGRGKQDRKGQDRQGKQKSAGRSKSYKSEETAHFTPIQLECYAWRVGQNCSLLTTMGGS
jgi:hypothetical protein